MAYVYVQIDVVTEKNQDRSKYHHAILDAHSSPIDTLI